MSYFKKLSVLGLVNYIAILIATYFLPATIPTHINLNGIVDAWSNKWLATSIVGLIPILIVLAMMLYRHLTITNKQVQKNLKIENKLFLIIEIFVCIIVWMPVLVGISGQFDLARQINIPYEVITAMIVGWLLIIVSYFLPKVKQNKYIGFRYLWTLKSEVVWNKTHKLVQKTGMFAGIVLMVGAMIGRMTNYLYFNMFSIGGAIILFLIVPIIYSYKVYKKEQLEKKFLKKSKI